MTSNVSQNLGCIDRGASEIGSGSEVHHTFSTNYVCLRFLNSFNQAPQCKPCMVLEHWDHGFKFHSRCGCISAFFCTALCR